MLDVGCGPGNALRMFRHHRSDLDYTGMDATIQSEAGSEEGLQFVSADITQATGLPAGQYDLVTCYFVIEHISLQDLEDFCRNLKSLVRPGGYLFLTAPNSRSVLLDFYDDPTHVRPYNGTAMCRLFQPMDIMTVAQGVDRSWKILLLSPFYSLYTLFKKDRSGISFFRIHLFGVVSFFLGKCPDDQSES